MHQMPRWAMFFNLPLVGGVGGGVLTRTPNWAPSVGPGIDLIGASKGTVTLSRMVFPLGNQCNEAVDTVQREVEM